MKRVWKIEKLTLEDELQIGAVLHRLILDTNPIVEGAWADRLDEAVRPLLKIPALKQSRYRYTFTVLESDSFNAFSHPGGYIYVSRKLMDSFAKDEPYGLQFVVAHEMAHVERHDALLCLRSPDLKKLSEVERLGTVETLYGIVLPLAYTEQMDYAADEWALTRMSELGHGRRETLAFLRKLEARARLEHFGRGRLPPERDKDGKLKGSPLDNHIRAHVSAGSRLERAGEFWDGHRAPRR